MRGKILIVDTDESVRDSIETAIGQAPFDVQLTPIPDDALGYIRKGKVDILVVDEHSVGPDFLEDVARDKPDVVRLLSTAAPQAPFHRTSGTRLLPKPSEPEELHNVLRDAMQQATVNFTACLCATLRPTPPPAPAHPSSAEKQLTDSAPTTLSRRELEVQTLLAQGFGSAHIARKLGISVFTVRNHTKSIYEKLGIHSRHELAHTPNPRSLES